MRLKLIVVIVVCTAVFATLSLLHHLQIAHATSPTNTLVLYDAALGGTPDTQNMEYAAVNGLLPIIPPKATQVYSPALQLTVLDTTRQRADFAGYGVTPTLSPVLSPALGFKLDFSLRIAAESHNNNDRAGMSVTFLGEDAKGIELGFWKNEIWAQEGGTSNLFTHAEGALFDTTTAVTTYQLEIIHDKYLLSADGNLILSGPLRDYSAWTPPLPGLPDPYEQPNLIALSDNTTSAEGKTWLSYVAVTTGTAPLMNLIPPTLTISETAGTAVFNVQLNQPPLLTVTVDFGTMDDTAIAGVDYTAVTGTLSFTPDISSQNITIPILDNNSFEPERQFHVQLTNPIYAQLGNFVATAVIQNDDVAPLKKVYLPSVMVP
ncbi:MAG: hypothetical protein GY796_01800 [Chloroflexi bacterium]|nr:hypothetical protein [Chloroflexota bacterium]